MDDIDTILPPAGDHDAGTIEAALLSWQLASLRHEAEIQELDRDWEAEENRLASGDRDGIGGTLPTSSGSAWNFVQLLVTAVVWLVVAPFAAGVIATARGPASVLGRFVPLAGTPSSALRHGRPPKGIGARLRMTRPSGGTGSSGPRSSPGGRSRRRRTGRRTRPNSVGNWRRFAARSRSAGWTANGTRNAGST
ncbi:MAG: hypothetical protein U0470_03450 [Anaerolineae bacterium]